MDSAIIEKVTKYSELVKNYIDVKKIILYGSYAQNKQRLNSDIDVAVVVDELKENYLEVSANLFTLSRKIDTSIEPKLIKEKNNRSGFLESIMKYGIVIYEKSN